MRHVSRPLFALVLLPAALFALPPKEKANKPEDLYGEWEVVEMIYKTTPQDFVGGNGGWFIFDKGTFTRVGNVQERDDVRRGGPAKKFFGRPCVIQGRHLHIQPNSFLLKTPIKAIWELQDGTLRIAWGETGFPSEFDEACRDTSVTLFVLKREK